MKNIRTDLAVEAREICQVDNKLDGVLYNKYKIGDINVSEVDITNDIGETNMGKPVGKYITIDIPQFAQYDSDLMDDVSRALAQVMSSMVKIEQSVTAMVVGLGNWNVTPDALGPKTVSRLMVTRHLRELIPDQIDEGIRPVCAMSPGVLGLTGIETSEIIKAVSGQIKPNIIICIDALASRRLDRVNNTIQICNTGISPGSGVGNSRMEISEKTLGIPVIAIGIPTVVDAATMANDTIDLVVDEMIRTSTKGSKFYNILKEIDRSEKEKMLKEVLRPQIGDLIVTPKEVDTIIDSLSKIVANGINIALQPALDLEDINKYLN